MSIIEKAKAIFKERQRKPYLPVFKLPTLTLGLLPSTTNEVVFDVPQWAKYYSLFAETSAFFTINAVYNVNISSIPQAQNTFLVFTGETTEPTIIDNVSTISLKPVANKIYAVYFWGEYDL